MPSDTDAGRRAPRRDAAENREALLTAAAAALAASPDASLEAIAADAGLSRRSVYGHFANRDELILALIDRGAARFNAVAAGVDHHDASVALALLGTRLWHAIVHVRLLARIALREPYVERVADAVAPVRARLGELVARGAADGTVRSDIRPPVLARLIEEAAIAVLVEAAAHELDDEEGRRLVMLAVLGTAGLSWREAGALIAANPELSREASE
ncbi:TetR family transcriptional regulator [Agromyces tardus]|jgi:AcrR family transcriptional regulator|uniref:TetR family transcriptional regulator n=1 Tax=Agromyces tardus TaxID=2583849 RepID=A0A3M8A8D6_9MICO|nr:TetR/AcrR family transcriptional regulator [Agromyces tardus]RNB46937.1 TetR family transcriptional regulator [Agromyces tardus]